MIKKYWKIAAAAAFLTAAGFCYGFLRGEPEGNGMKVPEPDGILETVLAVEESENDDGAVKQTEENGKEACSSTPEAAEEDSAVPESEPVCFVHICGEVAKPGVYELPNGSRIFQAVEAAGGMTEQAAADSVNLAALVRDGMRVKIPSLEEVKTLSEEDLQALSGSFPNEAGTDRAQENGVKPVNLNTAGAEELMSLNGIGKARAEEIIRYRTEHGGFQSIEDIKAIPGIKDALFQKIKDSITV